jgi:L-lactate dehydrogenase complex protein LldF
MSSATHRSFHDEIRLALADPQLQAALDSNAEKRTNAIGQAFEGLPESRQSLRQRAHQVRMGTIANLDAYLEQFIANAQANGLIVHRAADASQAVEIVLQIAREVGAGLIAKSKSMISEEIGLNHVLEARGLQVVETDLGEYIVQLRGEPPAHIITPAVHLNRAQVGQTFAEKLGISFSDDIPTLTTEARRRLRQTFLEARVGISGVNFGVAETGGLCLVTNEGNGRMCTTLPPVHIALMGIERLAPTLEDLALLLYLLPRSATGQKLSVYTSLIHSPRRPGEVDGPFERHLVLIDNGRSTLRSSSLAEALCCIRCGACLNVCPVFREIGGYSYRSLDGKIAAYPGPIGAVIMPGLFGVAAYGHLARASSLCGACKEACPVDIDLPGLLLRVRAMGADMSESPVGPDLSLGSTPPEACPIPYAAATIRSHAPRSLRWGLRLFRWMAVSPRRFSTAQRLAGFASRLLPARRMPSGVRSEASQKAGPTSPAPAGWLRLPDFTGWGYQRDIPRPAMTPFHARFAKQSQETDRVLPPTIPEQSSPLIPAQAQMEGAESGSSSDSVGVSSPGTPLAERFAEALTELGGSVTRCSPGELAERILEALRAEGIQEIQAWDEAYLLDPNSGIVDPGYSVGLLEALRAGGMRVVSEPQPQIRAGLTGALAGVAESGTLALLGGVGMPQTASLLPEIHLAVLRVEDIYGTLPEVLRLPAVRQALTLVLISGPSRTADIEMTLTIGVHGPRQVHAFLIGSVKDG